MIPSTTNKLLVAEDWTKIYQTFRNADFKSYDFETLRRTMINYLRENYPEEFNDYIDSSEFIALVDLIAYLGQNLSFRIDLNARENFLETAERRESILRLARLINYNVKRNVPANGFLKIASVATTENVIDSNGINLSNSIVGWNDPTNASWYQQFIAIMNSAMSGTSTFGKPSAKDTINGIASEQYKINTNSSGVPIYTFSKNVGGSQMSFELVSSSFTGKSYVYEETPSPANQLGIIFKNDNGGSGSANTGFFVQFCQGSLATANFSITTPVPNEVVGVNVPDINDTDVWLWQLSADGTKHETLWSKVPALTGNNVIYNSLSNSERNIYGVTTRENDQIDLNFADGSFGNLPSGAFKLYYRQSNGLQYSIKPEQMNNISVQIPYTSKSGQSHNLTIILSLQYTVTNSASAESNATIKVNAPQAYYTQNRMVTAEDYNIAPLTVNSNILKIKSINRTSSGISKYFELSDISGNFSSTNIFSNDGVLYKQNKEYNFDFTFSNRNEIFAMVKSQLATIIDSPSVKSFYFDNFTRPSLVDDGATWYQSNVTTNQTRGYFNSPIKDPAGPISIGAYGTGNFSFFQPGALIKFVPPVNQVSGLPQYFNTNGTINALPNDTTRPYKWVQLVGVTGDGANNGLGNLDDGTGPVILTSTVVGDGTLENSSIPVSIIPKFQNILSYAMEIEIVNIIASKRNFGLSFNDTTKTWYIISDSNLDLTSAFSLSLQGNISNINKDASWMVAFEWTGKKYKVRYRTTEHIFESDKETAFFVDTTKKNYDFTTDTVIKDKIAVLGINRITETPTVIYSSNERTPYTITTRTLTTASSTSSNILHVDTTGLIANRFKVIHPFIGTNSQALVVFVNTLTNYIKFDNTLTSALSTNTAVVFAQTFNIKEADYTYSNTPEQLVSLGIDYNWQIDSAIIESDGYVEPKKVLVSFFDYNEDGQIDDPNSFNNIVAPYSVSPVTGYRDKFVYFAVSTDGLRYNLTSTVILAYPNEQTVPAPVVNSLYYFYDANVNVIKQYTENGYVLNTTYYAKSGRSNLKFHYVHNSGQERRIDPSKSNVVDIYVLDKTYDLTFRNWLASSIGSEPLTPTTQSLEENYSAELEPIKSISDEIIFHPAKYKVLFGSQASLPLQATFKAVRNPAKIISTTDIQTRILSAIEDFFAIDNWEFGQVFNFGELSTYVMNIMSPDITNFVIVPTSSTNFGSLYQITCQSNEIFVNGATVNNIQVIDSLTASELNLSSMVTSG